MHRAFGDDPRTETIAQREHGYLLRNLGIISQEYALLQISKLHDPALQLGRANLGLDFVLEEGVWDEKTALRLSDLRKQLDDLNQFVRPARNRVISHNDVDALVRNEPLGGFPVDLDVQYFKALEDFARIVHEAVGGGPFAFGEHARTDVTVLLNSLTLSSSESNP